MGIYVLVDRDNKEVVYVSSCKATIANKALSYVAGGMYKTDWESTLEEWGFVNELSAFTDIVAGLDNFLNKARLCIDYYPE